MPNKIGWCDMTFNPVWGCKNHCEYCYARGIAKRFYRKIYGFEWNYYGKNCPSWAFKGDYLERLIHFKPTFLVSQFEKKLPKKPQRIFVGSMSEIAHWEERWMKAVLGRILCYPQHTFIFLTKHPEVYLKYDFPENCWLGVTITDTKDYDYLEYQKFKISNPNNLKFISFEPLLDGIVINLEGIDWVIIGAETGNRKGKVIPQPAWIDYIVDYCIKADIPIYLKDSLKDIYLVEIKEFPKGGDLIEDVKN